MDLRQHDRLHAKVVVGTSTALVGSANFSANGMGLEGVELNGWEEAALRTSDPNLVKDARILFNALWARSQPIKDTDINAAWVRWKSRRRVRPAPLWNGDGGFSLDTIVRSDLAERDIFLAIWRAGLSDVAKAELGRCENELQQSFEGYECYSGWGNGSHLIDLYYGPRGGLRCDGASEVIERRPLQYEGGATGHLDVCVERKEIMGRRFEHEERQCLVDRLRPHMEQIWNSEYADGDEGGKSIRLEHVLDILNHRT